MVTPSFKLNINEEKSQVFLSTILAILLKIDNPRHTSRFMAKQVSLGDMLIMRKLSITMQLRRFIFTFVLLYFCTFVTLVFVKNTTIYSRVNNYIHFLQIINKQYIFY